MGRNCAASYIGGDAKSVTCDGLSSLFGVCDGPDLQAESKRKGPASLVVSQPPPPPFPSSSTALKNPIQAS